MIEIKHLRLLQALAEEGSLSAAARSLGYSQPAVTQQIQRLEADLNTPLLTRAHTGVRLTGAGEVLLRHGASVLSTLALARAEVEAVAGLRAGMVRVASFPSAAATVIPHAFAAVTQRHPGIAFTLLEALPDQALELLRNGECDLAVVYEYSTGFETEPLPTSAAADEMSTELLHENVYIALPREHPASRRRQVAMRDLSAERWIAGCPSCRGNLTTACAAAGFEPDVAFETDDYVALQGLVVAGLGVAMVPDLMLAAVHPDESLVLRRLSPAPMRRTSVVTSASLMKVPGIRQTVEALRTAAQCLRLVTVA
ncbi:LysR family transcriptional regulator [Lacisediminihabitans profunda]|uniref:LysR family transcriptional regulator n=1 Tax=Lacisediminihabitans profunda TaxID=2594790 RepID=A0A5C8UQ25_9MICO|nr:LysR family transcriptional regulator [Lacisediminihabitans profunda]TXN30004.1 LysR family transcriptional regulator [Lacisediminihabitans profunda]